MSLPDGETHLAVYPTDVDDSIRRLARYWLETTRYADEKAFSVLKMGNFLRFYVNGNRLRLPLKEKLYSTFFFRLRPEAMVEQGISSEIIGYSGICDYLREINRPFQLVLETTDGETGELLLVFTD